MGHDFVNTGKKIEKYYERKRNRKGERINLTK
jgi:hypothetical protein